MDNGYKYDLKLELLTFLSSLIFVVVEESFRWEYCVTFYKSILIFSCCFLVKHSFFVFHQMNGYNKGNVMFLFYLLYIEVWLFINYTRCKWHVWRRTLHIIPMQYNVVRYVVYSIITHHTHTFIQEIYIKAHMDGWVIWDARNALN